MERNAAIKILKLADECSASVHESFILAKENCEEHEFEAYRQLVGQIMAHLFLSIMTPVYDEHHDLAPEWYKEMDAKKKTESIGKLP